MASKRKPDKPRQYNNSRIVTNWHNIVDYVLAKDVKLHDKQAEANERKTEECWKIIESGLEDILSSRRSSKG